MLGLLALRPWTTYELAKQMQRSVRWFWPRAERKLYEEPKRLAALGLATVETTATGRRRSTVYQITTAGRHALRDWLRAGPGAPMQVEMEPMIRVFFADGASPEDLRATLAAVGAQAGETLDALGELAAGTLSARTTSPNAGPPTPSPWSCGFACTKQCVTGRPGRRRRSRAGRREHRGRRQVAAGSPEQGHRVVRRDRPTHRHRSHRYLTES